MIKKVEDIYSRIEQMIHEAEDLSQNYVNYDQYSKWKKETLKILSSIFSANNKLYKNFDLEPKFIGAFPLGYDTSVNSSCIINSTDDYKEKILQKIKILEDCLTEINDTFTIHVFIVHGHNEELKTDVQKFLQRKGYETYILAQQANKGQELLEKFMNTAKNIVACVSLFTADDVGRAKEEKDLKLRARQNVVFETGYFKAKLPKENIILICEENVERPSDIGSVVYIQKENWKKELNRELENIIFKKIE